MISVRRPHTRARIASLWRRAIGSLDHLPLLYNPCVARRAHLRELHARHNRAILRGIAEPWRTLILAASLLVWPFWSSWVVIDLGRRFGRDARQLGGPPRWRQALHAGWLAHTNLLHPEYYYYFNFWREPALDPGDFIPDGRAQLLFRALNRQHDLRVLDDKNYFAEACAAAGLPTPKTLARFTQGHFEPVAAGEALQEDIFIKPRSGRHAEGTARWLFNAPNGGFQAHADSRIAPWRALRKHYEHLSLTRDYLVQPRLLNHPALTDLANDALCTVRVITVRAPDGLRVFDAIFNLPTGTAIINNLVDGALSSPVELGTGRLRAAFAGVLGKPTFATLPRARAPLEGRVLPLWRETVALAERAHALLTPIAFVGWDIALTPDGPVLLEGNHGLALNFHHLFPGRPLGQTEFPALVLHHLRSIT